MIPELAIAQALKKNKYYILGFFFFLIKFGVRIYLFIFYFVLNILQ